MFRYYSLKFIFIIVFINIKISFPLILNKQSNEYLGSSSKHLFHFVHVTDIHVTHLDRPGRMEQFEQFCNQIIKDLIKPAVTVVSGDLVNSVGGLKYKNDRLFGTAQYEQEWQIYQNILNRTNVTKYTKWLDLKGNHDAFMDSDPDSIKSFYRIYSNQGHDHSGSYAYTYKTTDNETYSFISVDMCPRPGLGRPLNFLGYLNKKEKKILSRLSEETKNSTSVIFFGHYPLSFTYSSGIDKIMKYGIVYLNGHLHSGIKHLYARHSNGLLELELGDWKDKRRFRIVTIDAGLLSFEDYRYGQSIYAVISNPKAAKFHTPREPFYRLNQSTHIRILIFSKLPIINVDISIDENSIGSARQSIDNKNLFIFPWNTSLYNDENLHEILVQIKDNANNTLDLKHEFCLSLSKVTKWNRSKFILTIHQPTFGFVLFISSLVFYIIILIYYRYQAKYKLFKTKGCFTLWNRIRMRMTLLCSVDLLYYPLIIFAFYQFIGPWYFGYLTKNHLGISFLWGTFIQGVYLPPDSQIFIGFVQLYLYLFPLTYSLSSVCYYRYNIIDNQILSHCQRCFRIYTVYILYIWTLFLILLFSYILTASFRLSWIVSPFGVFLAIFSIVLYIKAHRLKFEDFKLKLTTKATESINPLNDHSSKLIHKVDDQQLDLPLIKSQ